VEPFVGGEGAPDLTESLLNFTVNTAALAGFSWLFSRDYQASEKDRVIVDREEALGRLLASLSCMHARVTANCSVLNSWLCLQLSAFCWAEPTLTIFACSVWDW